MVGLVLQGGGAKGAFQAGAIRALREEGVTFDGVVGTSIGAVNGAMVAQEDYDLLAELWYSIDIDTLFEIEKIDLPEMIASPRKTTMKSIVSAIVTLVKDKGIDMTKSVDFISKFIDEKKIRESKIEYGLTTCELAEKKMTPLRLFKNDIPEGKMLDYIIASANFPLFQRQKIDDVKFVDGGMYDNLPISMLADKGYDTIYAIRLGASVAPVIKVDNLACKIIYIDPSEKPGTVLNFSVMSVRKALVMGYLDTKKQFGKFVGAEYYIKKPDYIDGLALLQKMDTVTASFLERELGITLITPSVTQIVNLTERLRDLFDLKYNVMPIDIVIACTEYLSGECEIERLKPYRLEDLMGIAVLKFMSLNDSSKKTLNSQHKKRLSVAYSILSDIVNKL